MKNKKYIFWLIMIITILSRLVCLGQYPGGMHADEAFAGYEAYSIVRYGIDSWGYKNPVYLTVWGSGMSVLTSYIMMPFISCFGLSPLAVRIPQALLGIITVFAFFMFLKKIADEKIAYWGTFLLAISPWHIMMSRYSMDCNYSPVFILLGLLFAIYGLEQKGYLIVSAFFWGISLYAYAINWIFVPAFLLGCFVYCLTTKKMQWSCEVFFSGGVIILLAMPLVLFVLINYGFLPEIRGTTISIPKLVTYRGNEISVKNIPGNLIKLLKLMITQNDYLIWNCIKGYGIYYLYSTPVVVYGAYKVVKRCIDNIKTKRFGYEFILVWWMIVGIGVGLIQGIGLNRTNCLLLVLFVFLAIGISNLCNKFGKKSKKLFMVAYLASFFLFEICYFGRYQDEISRRQCVGLREAVEYAESISDEEVIYVVKQIRHSQILFSTQYPTDNYINTVIWTKTEDARDVTVQSFGNFCWDWNMEEPNKGVYIILDEDIEKYEKLGYRVTVFDSCAVAVLT